MIVWVIAGMLGVATGLRVGWAVVNKQSVVSAAMMLALGSLGVRRGPELAAAHPAGRHRVALAEHLDCAVAGCAHALRRGQLRDDHHRRVGQAARRDAAAGLGELR